MSWRQRDAARVEREVGEAAVEEEKASAETTRDSRSERCEDSGSPELLLSSGDSSEIFICEVPFPSLFLVFSGKFFVWGFYLRFLARNTPED